MPKACPVCGSRRWRKDGVTGNAICEDGHVFQVSLTRLELELKPGFPVGELGARGDGRDSAEKSYAAGQDSDE